MAPWAKAQNLLYVALVPGEIHVFSYPSGRLVGKLRGFDMPNGECVDASQDVFITDAERSEIVEYAHGGTRPIATIADSGEPWDCSIDPTTGDIAVANAFDTQSRHGNVEIYNDKGSSPMRYVNRHLYAAFNCAYDGSGNLFVSGKDPKHLPVFLELRKGSKNLTVLHLHGIGTPGPIEWDGKYIVVAAVGRKAESLHKLYRISGTAVVGSTTIRAGYTRPFFWVAGDTVIVTDTQQAGGVGVWRYPGGGKPTARIFLNYQPAGVAVSMAPRD
jgi:hypothetical protein